MTRTRAREALTGFPVEIVFSTDEEYGKRMHGMTGEECGGISGLAGQCSLLEDGSGHDALILVWINACAGSKESDFLATIAHEAFHAWTFIQGVMHGSREVLLDTMRAEAEAFQYERIFCAVRALVARGLSDSRKGKHARVKA